MPDPGSQAGPLPFANCSHLHRPGCAVRDAVGIEGGISENRYRLYGELHAELSQPRY